MGLKAKILEKLFFGSGAGVDSSIRTAVTKGPEDKEIEWDMSKATGIPLRYNRIVTTDASGVDEGLTDWSVNTIRNTVVWTRISTGLFHAEIFDLPFDIKDVLKNKRYYYNSSGTFLGWAQFSKISSTVFAMTTYNASGALNDEIVNDYINVEIVPDV